MYQRLDEEHYVENPFLAQLLGLGWEVYKQNSGDPQDLREIKSFDPSFDPLYDECSHLRESFRDIILEDVLRKSIKKINPWIEEDQINEVVRRITTPTANFLLEANNEIHDLLVENTSVSENRRTGEKSPTVKFIDFSNPKNNSFIAISQFKVNIPAQKAHNTRYSTIRKRIAFGRRRVQSPTTGDPIGGITQLLDTPTEEE